MLSALLNKTFPSFLFTFIYEFIIDKSYILFFFYNSWSYILFATLLHIIPNLVKYATFLYYLKKPQIWLVRFQWVCYKYTHCNQYSDCYFTCDVCCYWTGSVRKYLDARRKHDLQDSHSQDGKWNGDSI